LRLAAPGREPDSRRFAQLTHRYKSFNVSLTPHEVYALYVLHGTHTASRGNVHPFLVGIKNVTQRILI
jgi:hypothetical protein